MLPIGTPAPPPTLSDPTPLPAAPAASSLIERKRAINRRKQQRYLKKVRQADELNSTVKALRKQVRDALATSIRPSKLDFILMERDRPERAQPAEQLDKKQRHAFVQRERLRYKRSLHDWLSKEAARLAYTLDKINTSTQVTTSHYTKADLDIIMARLSQTSEDLAAFSSSMESNEEQAVEESDERSVDSYISQFSAASDGRSVESYISL